MNKDLKAMSGIVATALLLIVSVVAVVSFQNFYNNYQSGTFVKAEQESGSGATGVETMIGNDLYFKNTQSEDLEIRGVKINGIECSIASLNASANSIEKIDVSACTGAISDSKTEVVIITEDNVYSKYVFYKGAISSSGAFGGSGNVSWAINQTGSTTEIFRMFSATKSHISVAGTSGINYGFYLNHNSYTVGLGCSGTYETLFYLGDVNNSHVWIDNSSPQPGPTYNWQEICINTNAPAIDIVLNTSDMTSLDYTGILSIHRNDTLGGTISQLSDSDLPTKIWIKFG